MTRNIRGVEEIIKNYEAFLIDLWGVVHNGVKLFPNILKVLQKIKEYNKEVIFITNAPRRSNVIKDQLKFFGVDLYTLPLENFPFPGNLDDCLLIMTVFFP